MGNGNISPINGNIQCFRHIKHAIAATYLMQDSETCPNSGGWMAKSERFFIIKSHRWIGKNMS